MRITHAAEYAVRCMIYLSTRGKGILTSRREVAANAQIPTHFLAKIAQDLAKAGFIEIRQGARGGFVLLREPEEITLLQVVETIIGEIYLNDCIAKPGSCVTLCECTVQPVWIRARDQLRETLNNVTFAQLLAAEKCALKEVE